MESFNGPIIRSILDNDLYTFTQGQLALHRHPDVPVKFALFNRSKDIPLGDLIDEKKLRRELDNFAYLRLTVAERDYLASLTRSDGLPVFKEDYLDFLSNLNHSPYSLSRVGDQYSFEVFGPWKRAVYWEVPVLRIFLKLYSEALMSRKSKFNQDLTFAKGRINLAKKIKMANDNPDITFSDFGTRRAFSPQWHEYVIQTFKDEVSPEQFVGTSNVYFAMKYGLKPVGTNSHMAWQIYSGIYGSDNISQLAHSQTKFLADWWDEYGLDYSIALTDTFTTDFFYSYVFTAFWAKKYKGVRQDSGQPTKWAEQKTIPFYQCIGINPLDKLCIMADGQTDIDMPLTFNYLRGKLWITFGWGTNKTNHLCHTIRPPSLVIKAVEAYGRPLIKLSDNPNKAIGDLTEIERIRKMIGAGKQEMVPVIY